MSFSNVVRCSISNSKSAIKISGTKEGAKVEFIAPASEGEKIVKLIQTAYESSFLVEVNIDGKPLSFWASFPQTSAFSGSGETIKFRLNIPESEIESILALILYGREKELNLNFSFDFEE